MELCKLAGKSPYVLPSLEGRRDKPMSDTSLNWALWQITRKRDGKPALLNIPHFTLHDFRRTGSTLLHENGYVSDVIEKQLGHTIKGVRGIYNKASYAPERRTMLQFWANYLDGLTQGKVIPLRAKGRKRASRSMSRLARRGEHRAPYPAGATPYRASRGGMKRSKQRDPKWEPFASSITDDERRHIVRKAVVLVLDDSEADLLIDDFTRAAQKVGAALHELSRAPLLLQRDSLMPKRAAQVLRHPYQP